MSASIDTLFATSFSWWERFSDAFLESRLQPGFSIRVSTSFNRDPTGSAPTDAETLAALPAESRLSDPKKARLLQLEE